METRGLINFHRVVGGGEQAGPFAGKTREVGLGRLMF
jgi:hypothetical protein